MGLLEKLLKKNSAIGPGFNPVEELWRARPLWLMTKVFNSVMFFQQDRIENLCDGLRGRAHLTKGQPKSSTGFN